MKPRPRLLLMVPLPPPVHGASLMSRQMAESVLLGKRFNLRVLPLQFADSLAALGAFSWRKVARTLAITLHLVKELVFRRPDLVVQVITPRGYSHYRDLGWAWLLRFFRVRRLCSIRERGFGDVTGRCARWRMRQMFRRAHAMVLSSLVAGDVSEWVPEPCVHAVPNGIPDLDPSAGSPKKNGRPVLLFLSNFMVAKGIYVLLEAAGRLQRRNLDFLLILAGAYGPDVKPAELKNRIHALNLENRVEIRGAVNESAKQDVLNRADLLVFPTQREAFGNVVLEGMRAGLAVVASREGSLPLLIRHGENGLLCGKRDSRELAAALERLILDPDLRRRMGKAGRALYEREFTREAFEERLLAVLDAVLEAGPC